MYLLDLMAAIEGDLLGVGDEAGVHKAKVALARALLGGELAEGRRHKLEHLCGDVCERETVSGLCDMHLGEETYRRRSQ